MKLFIFLDVKMIHSSQHEIEKCHGEQTLEYQLQIV